VIKVERSAGRVKMACVETTKAAEKYRQYRPKYPPELFRIIMNFVRDQVSLTDFNSFCSFDSQTIVHFKYADWL